MRSMMERLERYLEEKRLELNLQKTKIKIWKKRKKKEEDKMDVEKKENRRSMGI